MAGRDDLVPLPPIPEPERPDSLDMSLAALREERERIEEAWQRDAELRAVAYATVRAIYQHFATGSPSRPGLVSVLRAFATMLTDADAAGQGDR